ncbi:DUF3800 domain-containing protein [Rossellomorea vietnamensis]|uniref:DUF3800 domain-containing protein n=1 Tax=Rossellomorea vietnamensis TaxID=218284 RepID=UPI003CF66A79
MIQSQNIKVFFDESGKRKDKPNLMGGLSIPANIYASEKMELLSQKLRDGSVKLHWKEVTGKAEYRDNIINALELIAEHHQLIKFNVIHYDYSMLATRRGFGDDLIEKMIYTKFPERIIYGLLRGYGRTVDITTDIFIEDSTEYTSFKLNDLVKEQLNIQSLYRGEHYLVSTSQLVPKGEEIGVEVTDLLLGVIRNIIENKPDSASNGYAVRNSVIINLLKNRNFYKLITQIKYFEWTNMRALAEIDFNDYLQLFIANHYDHWE